MEYIINQEITILLLSGMGVIFFLCSLDTIGAINYYLNPEKYKKIDVSRKKIFIPFRPHHFNQKFRAPNVAFDGTVFKVTYILTIIEYIYTGLGFIALWIWVAFFPSKLAYVIWLVAVVIPRIVLVFIQSYIESRYEDRIWKEGPKFKVD